MLTLFKAHTGYLHLLSACLRWSSSSLTSWLLEQTVLVLFLRVLITLNIADRWWWLSHCKYKSVCGHSVHRCKERIIRLWHHYCIKEGDGPISFGIFCCKLDIWVHLVDVLQELFFLCRLYDYKSVIYISLPYSWRMFTCVDDLHLKVLHVEFCHNWADRRPHVCSL